MENVIIPAILFAAGAVLIWKHIETRHRERMAIIDKSLDPGSYKELYGRPVFRFSLLANLKWGLLAVSVGGGVLYGEQFGDRYIAPFVFLAGGLALILYYFVAAWVQKREP